MLFYCRRTSIPALRIKPNTEKTITPHPYVCFCTPHRTGPWLLLGIKPHLAYTDIYLPPFLLPSTGRGNVIHTQEGNTALLIPPCPPQQWSPLSREKPGPWDLRFLEESSSQSLGLPGGATSVNGQADVYSRWDHRRPMAQSCWSLTGPLRSRFQCSPKDGVLGMGHRQKSLKAIDGTSAKFRALS